MDNQPTMPIRLPECFLMDASPIMDDARNYEGTEDAFLIRMRPVVALIDAAAYKKDGSVTINVDRDGALVIVDEAKFRAEQARDIAAGEWDSERMRLLAYARSHDITGRKARMIAKALDQQSPIEPMPPRKTRDRSIVPNGATGPTGLANMLQIHSRPR